MRYRPEVDGLRSVAVVPVILFHAGLSAIRGGFVGVDVFFVISGYLITSIIIDQHQRGTFSLLDFYARRARRILPALFLVVLCMVPFAWLWMVPGQLREASQSVVAVSVFASNVLFWLHSGYFDRLAAERPLLHTWSLGVEEQFYLLFPVTFLLLWRFGKRWLGAVVVALAIVSLTLAEYWQPWDASAAFYLLPTRAWELAIGVLCALSQFKQGQLKSELLSAVGLVLIATSVFVYDETVPFPSLYTLVPVGGTALVILFAAQHTRTARLLSARPLVGIGLVSYSAYLWHQPLFALARIRSFEPPGTFVMLALSGLSVLLAYVSWRFVEQPIRHFRGWSPSRVLVVAAAVSAVFLGIGAWGYLTDGFRTVKTTGEQRALLDHARISPKRGACHTRGRDYLKPANACEYFDGTVTWAVLGDSHAVELAFSVAERGKGFGVKVKHLSFSGCGPALEHTAAEEDCRNWTREAVTYLAAERSIDTVLVNYRLHKYLSGEQIGVFPEVPNSVKDDVRDAYWTDLVGILRMLSDANKRVVLVLQAPELRRHVEELIMAPGSRGDRVGVTRQWWEQRKAFVDSHLRDLPRHVLVIDPTDLFCDRANCYAVRNQETLYYDADHLSLTGASYVARRVFETLVPGVQAGEAAARSTR
jgi:peptidoglycan/LPS O-acetylase OafA/YrhL